MSGEYKYEPKIYTPIQHLQSPEGRRFLVSKNVTDILKYPHAAEYFYTQEGMEFLLSRKGNLATSSEFKAFLDTQPGLKRMLKVESDAAEASAILNRAVSCILCLGKIVKDKPVVRMECTSKMLFHKTCMDPYEKQESSRCMVCGGSCQVVAEDVRGSTLKEKIKKRTDMRKRVREADLLRLSHREAAQKAGEEALNQFMRDFKETNRERYDNVKKMGRIATRAMYRHINQQLPITSKFTDEDRERQHKSENRMKEETGPYQDAYDALKRDENTAYKEAYAAANKVYEEYLASHKVRVQAFEPVEEDDLTQELRCVIA